MEGNGLGFSVTLLATMEKATVFGKSVVRHSTEPQSTVSLLVEYNLRGRFYTGKERGKETTSDFRNQCDPLG